MRPAYFAADDPEQSIPLLTPDEEREMHEASLPESLPILTLRNTVLYPGVVLPITVGRDSSLKLVKDANGGDPFSEAVPVYNNVENGFGIFAGYSADSVVLDVSP